MDESNLTDRRTRRTRRALADALLSLLPERGWDELSVQDICQRADVGRSTFYAHFRSKEELLTGSLDELRQSLHERMLQASDDPAASPLGFVGGLIDHVREQRKLSRAIFGRRSGHVVQMRFREMVARLVGESLARVAPPGWRRDAATHYIAGALVELLAWWLDARSARSAQEVEEFFLRLTRPLIQELVVSDA
jgi:AcrR family transcriptional regulator